MCHRNTKQMRRYIEYTEYNKYLTLREKAMCVGIKEKNYSKNEG